MIVVGFGSPLNPDQPNPEGELSIMAIGNIGQRIPLIAKGLQADGSEAVLDGEPTWIADDPGVVEVRETDGQAYGHIVSAGSSTMQLKVDADRTAGIRELIAVGLIIGNDPATEAQTVEIEFGAAEDVPAEEPPA
jgi:hypothetical protein